MGNHDHFDAIIKLLSVSVSDNINDTNNKRLVQADLCKYITIIIKNSNGDHSRYIPCLKLISTLSDSDPQIADKFMETYVHTNLLNCIRKSLNLYKKNQSLITDPSKVPMEIQRMKYLTFAAEIHTLGSLLQA